MNNVRKNEIQIVLDSIAERCATANIVLTATGELYIKDKLTGVIYKIKGFEV